MFVEANSAELYEGVKNRMLLNKGGSMITTCDENGKPTSFMSLRKLVRNWQKVIWFV